MFEQFNLQKQWRKVFLPACYFAGSYFLNFEADREADVQTVLHAMQATNKMRDCTLEVAWSPHENNKDDDDDLAFSGEVEPFVCFFCSTPKKVCIDILYEDKERARGLVISYSFPSVQVLSPTTQAVSNPIISL